jgi:hypothetical protein
MDFDINRRRIYASKRYLVAVWFLLLIAARVIWPSIKIDEITLFMSIIATFILFLPELAHLINIIKGVKYGDFEVIFNKNVEDLKKADKMVKSDSDVQPMLKKEKEPNLKRELEDVEMMAKLNIRSSIMMLSSKMEKRLFEKIKIDDSKLIAGIKSAISYMGYGATELKLWSRDVVMLFGLFWRTRNSIVHTITDKYETEKLEIIYNIGIDLYKIIWYATKDLNKNVTLTSP